MPNLINKVYDRISFEDYEQTIKDNGAIFLGEGASRKGYKYKKSVIKIPHNEWGFQDNIIEAYAYNLYGRKPDENGYIFAPCKLLNNGCLLMVLVDRRPYKELPSWANYIDGGQCGIYNGRWVVYDSACDIRPLRFESTKWANVAECPNY